MIAHGNLFTLPLVAPAGVSAGERFDCLLERPGVLLERIVSTGQASPPDFWYDAPRDEWVVLLSGAARLRIDGEDRSRELHPGDWILLPAHCRHRVDWTDPDQPTRWLALHLDPTSEER